MSEEQAKLPPAEAMQHHVQEGFNKASSQFKGPDGAVLDATPEGQPRPGAPLYEEKPPLNPYTKSYKANFPARDEAGQNAAPTVDAE